MVVDKQIINHVEVAAMLAWQPLCIANRHPKNTTVELIDIISSLVGLKQIVQADGVLAPRDRTLADPVTRPPST